MVSGGNSNSLLRGQVATGHVNPCDRADGLTFDMRATLPLIRTVAISSPNRMALITPRVWLTIYVCRVLRSWFIFTNASAAPPTVSLSLQPGPLCRKIGLGVCYHPKEFQVNQPTYRSVNFAHIWVWLYRRRFNLFCKSMEPCGELTFWLRPRPQ